jgi:hypothetical protein
MKNARRVPGVTGRSHVSGAGERLPGVAAITAAIPAATTTATATPATAAVAASAAATTTAAAAIPTAATTTTTTTTAVATAPATAAATTEATTASTGLAGSGFVDDQGSAAEVRLVQGLDRPAGLVVVGHFDEAEAAGSAGFTIDDDAGGRDGPVLAEEGREFLIRGPVRQISDVDVHDAILARRKNSHSSSRRLGQQASRLGPGRRLADAASTGLPRDSRHIEILMHATAMWPPRRFGGSGR